MTSVLLPPPAPPKSTDQPIGRVVLIDPRPERREIMSLVVDRSTKLTVVGLAASLEEADALIRAEHADIALLEIQMPVADGLAAVGTLRKAFPELRIVVCSFRFDSTTREQARVQGADGYLTKPFRVEDLLALLATLEPAPPSS